MEGEPLVSILVPVYNVESFLPDCLRSITNQTYSNLQIVVIDDGSQDCSWEIMTDFANKDSRIEIYQQKNQGVAATRNHLLEKANGDYYLFVDSDDWLESEAISYCLDIITNLDVDFIYFNQTDCLTLDQETSIKLFLEHKAFRGMLWNKLIKAELFENCFFDERISYGEDALFIWHILQKINNIIFVNKQFYNYRFHNNNLSNSAFNDKKFSAYYVWKDICSDTERYWPQFLDIARARYAIEMTILIRDAVCSKSKDKSKIRKMQQVIKKYGHLIAKTKLSSHKMIIYSWLAARSYFLIKVFKFIY
ncbi:MAG: glycosyltransferase family 2 protein [Muribaculaceae bacterium]|nr:glycosyltransferase family 2 protein [Muribaculaceae bacterium]